MLGNRSLFLAPGRYGHVSSDVLVECQPEAGDEPLYLENHRAWPTIGVPVSSFCRLPVAFGTRGDPTDLDLDRYVPAQSR